MDALRRSLARRRAGDILLQEHLDGTAVHLGSGGGTRPPRRSRGPELARGHGDGDPRDEPRGAFDVNPATSVPKRGNSAAARSRKPRTSSNRPHMLGTILSQPPKSRMVEELAAGAELLLDAAAGRDPDKTGGHDDVAHAASTAGEPRAPGCEWPSCHRRRNSGFCHWGRRCNRVSMLPPRVSPPIGPVLVRCAVPIVDAVARHTPRLAGERSSGPRPPRGPPRPTGRLGDAIPTEAPPRAEAVPRRCRRASSCAGPLARRRAPLASALSRSRRCARRELTTSTFESTPKARPAYHRRGAWRYLGPAFKGPPRLHVLLGARTGSRGETSGEERHISACSHTQRMEFSETTTATCRLSD